MSKPIEITQSLESFSIKSLQDVEDMLNHYVARREGPLSIVNIKRIYCGKKGFNPSSKLQKMLRVKQYFVFDEAQLLLQGHIMNEQFGLANDQMSQYFIPSLDDTKIMIEIGRTYSFKIKGNEYPTFDADGNENGSVFCKGSKYKAVVIGFQILRVLVFPDDFIDERSGKFVEVKNITKGGMVHLQFLKSIEYAEPVDSVLPKD